MSRVEQMETFVAIADAESLSGAAQSQGIAVSAVSRRLKALEARLGTTLYLRSTRRISLTEAGTDFLQKSRQIISDIEDAENAMVDGQGDLVGRIRIAAPLTFSTMHLGPVLSRFMALHPEVSMEAELNDRRVDLIAEGFDLAIRVGRLADSTLIAKKITQVHHCPCVSPKFIEQNGWPNRPEELSKFPGLMYRTSRSKTTWPFVRPDGTKGNVNIVGRFAANNGDILRDAAEAGLGVILEPTFITYTSILKGTLIPLFADHEWSDNAVYAVYAENRSLPRRVRTLIDFLAREFSPEPAWDRVIKSMI
ncbi:MAG: LysR family transcriptional regulator [Halopseudomonas aestusnigri]